MYDVLGIKASRVIGLAEDIALQHERVSACVSPTWQTAMGIELLNAYCVTVSFNKELAASRGVRGTARRCC